MGLAPISPSGQTGDGLDLRFVSDSQDTLEQAAGGRSQPG